MRRSGMTWATVGLIVLAVVAVVLAFAALRSTRGTGTPGPSASVLTKPTDKASKGDGKNGHDKETGTLGDAIPDAIEPPLLMVSSSLAYRARTGSCLGGSGLERSTDGGVKWKPVTTPAAAILSLSSSGGDTIDVVGADDRCKTKVWSSTDQGDTWSDPASASDEFARVPDDPSKLATPTGEVKSPCPGHTDAPISVDGISAVDAAVLCASGDVVITQDGGATWLKQKPVVGADAMAFEGPQLGWVLRSDSGQCPVYQLMQTQDAGLTWQTGGCLWLTRGDDRQLPSLSFADPTNGMADLAGVVYVTSDSGLTWNEAS